MSSRIAGFAVSRPWSVVRGPMNGPQCVIGANLTCSHRLWELKDSSQPVGVIRPRSSSFCPHDLAHPRPCNPGQDQEGGKMMKAGSWNSEPIGGRDSPEVFNVARLYAETGTIGRVRGFQLGRAVGSIGLTPSGPEPRVRGSPGSRHRRARPGGRPPKPPPPDRRWTCEEWSGPRLQAMGRRKGLSRDDRCGAVGHGTDRGRTQTGPPRAVAALRACRDHDWRAGDHLLRATAVTPLPPRLPSSP